MIKRFYYGLISMKYAFFMFGIPMLIFITAFIETRKKLAVFHTLMFIFSGGLQDAYTYFARNKVFANAQTGNIVLMASKLSDGQYADAIRYVFPV